MIDYQVRDYIAQTMLTWLRDPHVSQEFVDWTPRGIRDHILHMIPAEGVSEAVARRIANALTRWMGDEEGYVRVRYYRDGMAHNVLSRKIEEAVEDRSAGKDDDITDDLTAPTYANIVEWIDYVRVNMREFAREQRKIGTRPKKAKELLLQLAAGSIEDAMME